MVLDASILGVAIPTLVNDLGTTNTQIQWILDAYTLVFACLLLTGGALGDRYGRKLIFEVGLAILFVSSALAALCSDGNQLIGARALMGIGGALIMPATLSILANIFPPEERARAIGIWAAAAGIAGLCGPVAGGILLRQFYWGSVFLVALPIIVIAFVGGFFLIPETKDPTSARLDIPGAILSMAGLGGLLFAVIEGPDQGWGGAVTVGGFVLGVLSLAAFVWWQRRAPTPMLDLELFQNARFTVGAVAIGVMFFVMFGTLFLTTQYFQFIKGWSPFETGIRSGVFGISAIIVSPLSMKVARRIGTKATVTLGFLLMATGFVIVTTLTEGSAYFPHICIAVFVSSAGLSLSMAPCTEAMLGTLPLNKSGVGSAVQATTRQVGSAAGIAIVGSVFASVYGAGIRDNLRPLKLTADQVARAKENVGTAYQVAKEVGGDKGAQIVRIAKDAFLSGYHAGPIVTTATALLTAVAVAIWLPSRARASDVEAQTAEQAELAALRSAQIH